MATVLDIRGTHGSGKSWIVHTLLGKYDHAEIIEEGKLIGYHLQKVDVAVVGKYTTACGGCDQVGSADEVVRRVRLFCESYKFVVLEGILVSHTFRRYDQLAMDLEGGGHRYRFFFLNTPLKVCIDRVQSRRDRSGNTKPLDPKNIIKDHASVWRRVQSAMRESGRDVTVLDYRVPMPTILGAILCPRH
ncbi:MAG: hypothetical protein WC455_11110 [Dehalococcoidia bacterium]|jgi:hypothetical protein